MHSRTGDIYWIEAEDFSLSNFAVRGTDATPPQAVMTTALASQGLFVVAFQRPGYFLEYAFREDRDGFWKYAVWMRYATPCPSTRLVLTLNEIEVASPLLPASGDFFTQFRWEKLGVIRVPKGNHVLRLTHQTGVIHPDVIVLSPSDDPVISGECERRIRDGAPALPLTTCHETVSRNRLWLEHDRNGVPLGGLGTGKVELCQDGGFANLSMNNNQDAPIASVPGAFFLVREVRADSTVTVRALSKVMAPCPEIESLNYHGAYPFANVEYRDRALHARIRLEAFAPMIPYNAADSSVPGALFSFELNNPGPEALTLTLGFSWENVIGCGGLGQKPEYGPGHALRVDAQPFWAWNDRTGNDQASCRTQQGTGLRFFRETPCPYDSSHGEYAVLCAHDSARVRVAVTRSYNVETDIETLVSELEHNPEFLPPASLSGPGREGHLHPAGIVWAELQLEPGQSETVTFALAWRFPIYRDRFGHDWGVNYAQRFADAAAGADFLLQDRARLAKASRDVPERIAASNLPAWLKTKIINDQFPLTTCSWFDRDGHFSVNEAPSKMHGCLGTIDQRTASQGIYTALFPELDRNELSLFAEFQHENGQIPHDLGHGLIDKKQTNYIQWPDLVCSFIFQVHRYVHATGDMAFARAMAARIPAAVNWVLSLDDDGDGVPDLGPGRGNTYDNNDWPGCSSFIASFWIAALQAAADMARLVEKPDEAARYKALSVKAAATMERRLWNGSFYRNFVCDDATRKDGEDCLLPQVAGEWALDLMDLPRGLPEDRVLSALRQIYSKNIVGKQFKGPADEVTPNGDPAWLGMSFFQYVWVYFGALAAYRGLTEEAAACWRQAYSVQWELNHQPWKTRLSLFALNGAFTGLPWYMTNTASWYILHALSGFAYSIPDGWLRVEPHVPPSWSEGKDREARLAMPLFGSGFRLGLDYRRDASGLCATLLPEGVWLPSAPVFKEIRMAMPVGRAIQSMTVNGMTPRYFTVDTVTGKILICLDHPWPVSAPLDLEIRLKKAT